MISSLARGRWLWLKGERMVRVLQQSRSLLPGELHYSNFVFANSSMHSHYMMAANAISKSKSFILDFSSKRTHIFGAVNCSGKDITRNKTVKTTKMQEQQLREKRWWPWWSGNGNLSKARQCMQIMHYFTEQQYTHSVTDLQYLLLELCCAPMETPIMVSVNVV